MIGDLIIQRAKDLVVDGNWTSGDTWGGMDTGMVAMAPYNSKLIPASLIQEV